MLVITGGMVSYDLLYLTVTCSEFARGFFWKLTSGWIPYSALLGWTVDTFLRQVTGALWFRLQKTAEFPQLQFMMLVDFSCRGAEAVSHGLAVQRTIEILLLVLNTAIDVPVAQVVQVPLCMAVTCSEFACGVQDYGLFWKMTSGWIPYPAPVGSTLDTCLRQFPEALWFELQKTVESPQLQFTKVVDIPFMVPRLIPMVFATIEFPQLQFLSEVIDVPVCRSCRSFTSLSLRRGGFPWSRLFVGPQDVPAAQVVQDFVVVQRQIPMVLLFSRP